MFLQEFLAGPLGSPAELVGIRGGIEECGGHGGTRRGLDTLVKRDRTDHRFECAGQHAVAVTVRDAHRCQVEVVL